MFRTWIGPKHVDVINKIDEIYWEYCAPSWFHLQDYIEMHSQQNIRTKQNYFWSHEATALDWYPIILS